MKTYIGERHGDTSLTRVLVDDPEIEVRALLEHYVRHSPTGFEWGYGGSGPSDLARCILIDHLDLHANPEALNADYQKFKFDVIAQLDRDGFELPASRVEEWLGQEIDAAMTESS